MLINENISLKFSYAAYEIGLGDQLPRRDIDCWPQFNLMPKTSH